jgi:hypothetical protein
MRKIKMGVKKIICSTKTFKKQKKVYQKKVTYEHNVSVFLYDYFAHNFICKLFSVIL